MLCLANFILMSLALTVVAGCSPSIASTSDQGTSHLEYVQLQSGTLRLAVVAKKDKCDPPNPPPECVFMVRRDGQLVKPDGNDVKDWSRDFKAFQEKNPGSAGPMLKGPKGERYRLERIK